MRPADPHSVRQLARQRGIRANTIYERLRRGWTLDQALGKPVRRQEVRGLAAMARRAGLPRTTVSERLRRGWTLAEALETPRGQSPARLADPYPTPESPRPGRPHGRPPAKAGGPDDD